MLVVALKECFIDGHRRRAGVEFEFDVETWCKRDKEGKYLLPAALRAASADSVAEAKAAGDAERNKGFHGAMAAAGPKRAGTPKAGTASNGLAGAEDLL